MLFTLRERRRTSDSALSRVRSKILRLHPRRLDSEALRRLQRWGLLKKYWEWMKMRFIRVGRVEALLCMVLFVLSVSNILAISGCAGPTKISPPMELVRVGQDSGGGQVKLTWDDVSGDGSYYLYVSKAPGAKEHGERFINVANPVTVANLEFGTKYYFVV